MAEGTVQTEYAYISTAVAGQLVDMYFNEVVSMIIEETDGVEFGKALVRGTNANQVSLGVGTFGIAVRELTREMDQRGSAAVTKYNDGNGAAVMRKGHIYVELDATSAASAVAGGQVAALADGSIVTSGTTDATDISGATFEAAADAGDIVEIRLA